ncbi:esterase/lipase/thioesterase family active site:lipase (class 3) [Roseobacter sp. SK209-2-6]|nr:esterase/lipase/thioesterase family active site:lipase (class 3) [Roseobacter sp. SK209-2-6]
MSEALKRIEQVKRTGRRVYVVAFVHGHHQGSETPFTSNDVVDDPVKFKFLLARQVEHLRRQMELRGETDIPEVIGVFVGWRGDTILTRPFKTFTLNNRSHKADYLGKLRSKNSVFYSFKQISSRLNPQRGDKMLILSHSLGARLVSRFFIEDYSPKNRFPFGEHVLTVGLQPAINSSCFDGIFGPKVRKVSQSAEPPGLLLISSKDDFALNTAFRLGRIGGAVDVCDRARRRSIHPIGLRRAYQTHVLRFEHEGSDQTASGARGCRDDLENSHVPLNIIAPVRSGESKSAILYPYYAPGESCYNQDYNEYSIDLSQRPVMAQYGIIWNIQTNKNTIDYAKSSSKRFPTHNGIISTNLSRFLVEWQFAAL